MRRVIRSACLGVVGALALCVVAGLASPVEAREGASDERSGLRQGELERHVRWLAADARRGRDTISPEAVEVSSYLARHFADSGVQPLGTDGTWFQPFTVAQPVLGAGNHLEVTVDGERAAYQIERDWNPFSVCARAAVEGEVAVCGYGIRAPGRSYDDFAGLDVRGKVVLVMRKNPGWREARHAAFLTKLKAAQRAGAAAVLLCNDPATLAAATKRGGKAAPDRIGHWTANVGAPVGSATLPYAFIAQHVAERMLASAGLDLKGLETRLRSEGPHSRVLPGVRVRLATEITRTTERNARNVVGLLPGRDPEVAHEVIVLGAHFDHVGLGLFGSTGGAAAAGQVHNGADDNASGTACLLELAAWFAEPAHRPRRSLVFVAFTGEERGLLGSRHYVEHPTVPLDDVVAMINLDMVGRCREGRLQIGGVGTGQGLRPLVETASEGYGFNITWDPGGEAPSDSTSFFRKDLPVLFFFTMLHADYHKPSDDVESVAFEPMARIAALVRDVCAELAEREERLVFTKPPAPPRPPRLGVQVAQDADAAGVRLRQIVPGGPAEAAGLLEGDVLVRIAGQVVRDRGTLLAALRRLVPGRPVGVELLRDDRPLRVQVVLAPPRGGR